MASAAELLLHIRAQDDATNVLGHLRSRVTALGAAMTTGLTAPIVGVGAAAFRMGIDFNDSLDRIVALVGLSREEVEAFKDDILALSGETARSPKELADALYFITSSGFQASEAMEVLRATATATAVGLGESTTVADVLTSALNAFGHANLSADQAAAILVATVREGKGEADELAGALGRVIPIAAEMGVSFDQVGAAVAGMTLSGLDAEEATTGLRRILVDLLDPSNQANEALMNMGLSAEGLRTQLREQGLLAVLDTLSTSFDANSISASEVFEDVRGLTAFLNLTGESAGRNAEIFHELAATTTDDLGVAFEAIAEGPGFRSREAINLLRIELVRLGDTIVPVIVNGVIPATRGLVAVLDPLITAFGRMPEPVQATIIAFLGIVAILGPVLLFIGLLLPALPLLASAFLLLLGPVGLIVLALAALVIAGIILWQNWETIQTRAQEIWDTILVAVNNFVDDWRELWEPMWEIVRLQFEAIRLVIENALDTIRDIFRVANAVLHGEWSEAWNALTNLVNDRLDFIRELIVNRLQIIAAVFAFAWIIVQAIVANVWQVIIDIIAGAINTIRERVRVGFNLIHDIFVGAWQVIRDVFVFTLAGLVGMVAGLPQRMVDALLALPGMLFDVGRRAIQGFIDGLRSIALPDLTPGFDIPGVPFLHRGSAFVPRDMIAVLQRGEMVIPAPTVERVRRGGTNQSLTQNITIRAESASVAALRQAARLASFQLAKGLLAEGV